VINAHVADAINAQYPKAEGERFFTTDEERGIIVNFASVAGHDLYARCLSYGPTKAAVLGMTRSGSSCDTKLATSHAFSPTHL